MAPKEFSIRISRAQAIALAWRALPWKARVVAVVLLFPWTLAAAALAWVFIPPRLAPVIDTRVDYQYVVRCSPVKLDEMMCVYEDRVVQAPVVGWH